MGKTISILSMCVLGAFQGAEAGLSIPSATVEETYEGNPVVAHLTSEQRQAILQAFIAMYLDQVAHAQSPMNQEQPPEATPAPTSI